MKLKVGILASALSVTALACSLETNQPGSSTTGVPRTSSMAPSTSKTVGSSSSTSMTSTSTLPPEGVVFVSIPREALNTSTFQINNQTFPEFAQSFVLDRSIDVSEIRLAVGHAMIVQPEYFDAPFASQWKYYTTEPDYGPLDLDVTTAFYRVTTGELVSEFLDVTQGFDEVARSTSTVTMEKTLGFVGPLMVDTNVAIVLEDVVRLDPGGYLVVMSFSWEDRNVFLLRMFGRQAGNNTRLGYDQDRPGQCEYTPADDANPTGRAYTGLGVGRWDGTAEGSIGFGTTFRPAMAKVSECITVGQFGEPWNQGDVYLVLFGRPAS